MAPKTEYRVGVVGVFTNSAGEILVGQRSDLKQAWQLPQGGVDPGESNLAAIYREMEEEVGCGRFEIVKIASRQVRYTYPPSVNTGGAKNYAGQSQQWFLLKFSTGHGPDVKKCDGEFADFQWRKPIDVVQGIVEWKRPSYEEGFHLLGLEV